MNFSVQLGPVNVRFFAGTVQQMVRKAKNYLKSKPKDWDDDDAYFIVPVESDPQITFSLIPGEKDPDFILLNEEKIVQKMNTYFVLKDGTNEITVNSSDEEFTLVVHVVRATEEIESESGGILWDESEEIFYFAEESAGFFDGLYNFFWGSDYKQPAYNDLDDAIRVEADPITSGSDVEPSWPNQDPTPDSTPKVENPPAPVPDNECAVSGETSYTAPDPTPSYTAPDPTPSYTAPDPTPSYTAPSYTAPSSYDSGSSSYDSGSSSYDSGSSSCDSGGGGGSSD